MKRNWAEIDTRLVYLIKIIPSWPGKLGSTNLVQKFKLYYHICYTDCSANIIILVIIHCIILFQFDVWYWNGLQHALIFTENDTFAKFCNACSHSTIGPRPAKHLPYRQVNTPQSCALLCCGISSGRLTAKVHSSMYMAFKTIQILVRVLSVEGLTNHQPSCLRPQPIFLWGIHLGGTSDLIELDCMVSK